MKKTFQINIADHIYYINDDAYEHLQNYLNQLSATFTGDGGAEIVADIENRIGELFTEYNARGRNVIDINCVNDVIETVGKPEDLCDDACQSNEQHDNPTIIIGPTQKKLYRDPKDKMLGGVLGGLAVYLGWDATLLRILVVILALCTAVFPCFICYLIAWMIIPVADTPQKQLRMRGEPVNLDNIMQNIKQNFSRPASSAAAPPPYKSGDNATKDFFATALKIGVKILLGMVMAAAILGGCAALIWLLVILFLWIGGTWLHLIDLCHMFANSCGGFAPNIQLGAMGAGSLIGLLICVAIIWFAGYAGFNWKRPSTATWISLLIIFVLSVAALIISTLYLQAHGAAII